MSVDQMQAICDTYGKCIDFLSHPHKFPQNSQLEYARYHMTSIHWTAQALQYKMKGYLSEEWRLERPTESQQTHTGK